MKLQVILNELMNIKGKHGGEIDVDFQVAPGDCHEGTITSHEQFFIVPEPYEEGIVVNIRTFPY